MLIVHKRFAGPSALPKQDAEQQFLTLFDFIWYCEAFFLTDKLNLLQVLPFFPALYLVSPIVFICIPSEIIHTEWVFGYEVLHTDSLSYDSLHLSNRLL